jgi:galactokinase
MSTQQDVIAVYNNHFNNTPFVFFSPGRINLLGEHIDYNDGFVMPAAIDKGIWFAIAANGTEDITFVSADLDEAYTTNIQSIEKNESWKNYVLGVLHVLQEEQIEFKGFDCVFGGNLPVGAGLSSSAAVEGGLIFALNEIFGWDLSRTKMALLAQKAEHGYAGVKCGIMDMFASLNGKKNQVILLDCNSLEYEYFPLSTEDYTVVLINSKVNHSLASGEYNIRRKQCEEGLHILSKINSDYTSFRKIKPTVVKENKALFSEDVYKRCLYVTEEIERTQEAAKLLKANDLKAFGQLMFATHNGLSKLYDVSCNELDFLVEQAQQYPAIIGSRVMGGGFGGCTINLIEKEKATTISQEIIAAYKLKFGIDTEAYATNISDGTYAIRL